MKTLNRFFSIIALSCLMTVSALAKDPVVYDNGPYNGTSDAWSINFGFWVSDSFYLGTEIQVTGVDFWVWEFPGDHMLQVRWEISPHPTHATDKCSAKVVGPYIATASSWGRFLGGVLTDTPVPSVGQDPGYSIDQISITFPARLASELDLKGPCTYELKLYDAVVPSGDPVYWDENSGVGCGGWKGTTEGCPSKARESAIGSIPSESFDIRGH
jgi:hypothetical protein